MITPGDLEAVRLQAETTTALLKRARRAIVDALQSAAQLESMAAEIADQEDSESASTDSNGSSP